MIKKYLSIFLILFIILIVYEEANASIIFFGNKIKIGMTKKEVKRQWGSPNAIEEEIWLYDFSRWGPNMGPAFFYRVNRRYLFFEDGILVKVHKEEETIPLSGINKASDNISGKPPIKGLPNVRNRIERPDRINRRFDRMGEIRSKKPKKPKRPKDPKKPKKPKK